MRPRFGVKAQKSKKLTFLLANAVYLSLVGSVRRPFQKTLVLAAKVSVIDAVELTSALP